MPDDCSYTKILRRRHAIGPILPVITVKNMDEAIRIVKSK